MSKEMTITDPKRFSLESFADILPKRNPILGEDPGSFVGFHEGMMRSLGPVTPYECVIAENLIAIEWELLQHRRMRDAAIRRQIHTAIQKAVEEQKKAFHEERLDEDWDDFIEAGGDEEDWREPFTFDEDAAVAAAEDLARRAVSHDIRDQESAYTEIEELGLAPVEVMGEAYRSLQGGIRSHEFKIPELERRRREVRRDYDQLQSSRPVEAEVIEG